MKPFNRTVEKVLAWIANVLFFLLTGFLTLGAFVFEELGKNSDFIAGYNNSVAQRGATDSALSAQDAASLGSTFLKVYAVLHIIVLIIAIIASLTMKKRVLSGVLFIVATLGVALLWMFVMFPIYILYLVVAIMLFVRKEEPFNPMYVNQNPYVNNGADNNGNVYNQNVEGTNYQATNGEQNQEQKVDKIEYL